MTEVQFCKQLSFFYELYFAVLEQCNVSESLFHFWFLQKGHQE